MALHTLARRLPKTHPKLVQLLLRPVINSTSTSYLSRYFSQAFHRTVALHQQNPYFRTIRSFSAQNLYDPIDFHGERFQNYDVHNPFFVKFLDTLKQVAHLPTEAEAMASLEDSGIAASPDMVRSAIWALREEWRLAFLAFKWGEKGRCSDEEAWNLMIWVLGSHRKFNTAWCLIRDLHQSSLDTRRAMLIMIDRYASANDPCKAIWAFQITEKFSLTPDQEAFCVLLNVLCKHGYIEEAEEFMLVNKKLFPLETESFNIILNGWCNIIVDLSEAKRVWREMSKCCLMPDATSYTHMISCFSKDGNLFDSLRLYDEMKKRGWIPSIKVYNSLIWVLSHQNCFKEALKFLEIMKEAGLWPDSTTYNSMIVPLCKARKLEEARDILTIMIGENISPTIETFHAFLESAELEETLELLSRMKRANIGPREETFLMILEKFFKSEQPENALKIWAEMEQYEAVLDSTHYTAMIKGMANCGMLIEARQFLAAMRSDGFLEDPKLKRLVKEPVGGSTEKRKQQLKQLRGGKRVNSRKGK
ncbi:hypothetical protein UlMin_016735 [Ulmus minor]